MNLNYYKDVEIDKFNITNPNGRNLRGTAKKDYERLFKLDRHVLYRQHKVPRVKRWQVLKIP